jgi:hypothetical protein
MPRHRRASNATDAVKGKKPMPQPASALESCLYTRLLVMGGAKVGKSTTVISTSPSPVHVIECDPVESLKGAGRRTRDFEFDLVKDWDSMQTAIKYSREGVKAGKYKTIVLDSLTTFSDVLIEQCFEATKTNAGHDHGRKAYPEYHKRLAHVIDSLLLLKANVVVTSHFFRRDGEEIEGTIAKSGEGIQPLLIGQSREKIPAKFNDVVFMETKKGERIFVTSPSGVWGPGCRSLDGVETMPASIEGFIKAVAEQDAKDARALKGTKGARR